MENTFLIRDFFIKKTADINAAECIIKNSIKITTPSVLAIFSPNALGSTQVTRNISATRKSGAEAVTYGNGNRKFMKG